MDTLPKYKDVLNMGDKEVNEALAAPRIASAKKRAELKVCELEESIAQTWLDLQESLCDTEVSFSTIISLQNRISLRKREKKQYQMILDQMFPDE
jgi:hypothetical protein